MLSTRFAEIIQQPDAPFINAFAGRGNFFARSKDSATLWAMVKEDGVERGLDALLTEAERVERFGFTATEFERQKQNILRNYERIAIEKETVNQPAAQMNTCEIFSTTNPCLPPMTSTRCTNGSCLRLLWKR